MVDLNDYFNPVSIDNRCSGSMSEQAGFTRNINIHTENNPIKDTGKYKIAIVGVPDGRNSPDAGSMKAPDSVRQQLYSLARIPGKLKITDLGNLKQGATFDDTLAGLNDIISTILSENVFPVVIGGTSALIPAIDRALSKVQEKYSLASIDPRIDYLNGKASLGPFNYLNTILTNPSSTIGHFINIGYQTYLNDPQVINRFLKKKYDLVRIGDARQAMHLTEPLLRDAHAALFDISAVRQSDAPGNSNPSPNGFYGEEICLLSRYAGISDSLKVFGLFDINPDFDVRSQTTGIAAQIIWFFLEGFSQKQFETPVLGKENSGRFIKYHVRVTGMEDDLIFIRSSLTERWWMELTGLNDVPVHVACSHEDYLSANQNEIPDRWLRASDRLRS